MSGVIWLPQWERVSLGGPSGAPYKDTDNVKLLWHTWEGTNWNAAETAFKPYPPHCAAKIGDKVRQYVPLDEHAYALLGSANEGEFVIQVEVAGFAGNSRDMSEADKEWLAVNVLEPILFFHDVPDVHPPFYDDKCGFTIASANSPIRFGFNDWVNYSGHVGHQHAPAPDEHWDPGILDIDTIIRIARGNSNSILAPLEDDDMVRIVEFQEDPGKRWLITIKSDVQGQTGTRMYLPTPEHIRNLQAAGVINVVAPIQGKGNFKEVRLV